MTLRFQRYDLCQVMVWGLIVFRCNNRITSSSFSFSLLTCNWPMIFQWFAPHCAALSIQTWSHVILQVGCIILVLLDYFSVCAVFSSSIYYLITEDTMCYCIKLYWMHRKHSKSMFSIYLNYIKWVRYEIKQHVRWQVAWSTSYLVLHILW